MCIVFASLPMGRGSRKIANHAGKTGVRLNDVIAPTSSKILPFALAAREILFQKYFHAFA